MATLVTAQDVKDRIVAIGETVPSGLTDGIILKKIEGVTATILNRLGLSSLPSSGTLERDVADDVCLELVVIELKRHFFGLQGDAMGALNVQWRQTLERLDFRRDDAVGEVDSKLVGGDLT